MHADGAGTKSTLAYIHYKETGNSKIFQGIAQDSIVMNIDDLLCIGAVDNFLVSNTIGRNAHRVDGTVVRELIEGYMNFANSISKYGINMIMAGGETADVGDLVATLIVDSTVFTRLLKSKVIDCSNIQPGDVIIGLSSCGKAIYESSENSGIGSNGFTAARHLLLSKYYTDKYPETYSSTIEAGNVYSGKFRLEDILPGSKQTIGEALLSPTRTYAPIIKDILYSCFEYVHGIIHCTGGGQVKCKSFGKNLHFVKDNLFPTPPIFRAIMESRNIKSAEMYQIFNMGHRIEIYCDPKIANNVIDISRKFNVDAKIVGRVEEGDSCESNKVTILQNDTVYTY